MHIMNQDLKEDRNLNLFSRVGKILTISCFLSLIVSNIQCFIKPNNRFIYGTYEYFFPLEGYNSTITFHNDSTYIYSDKWGSYSEQIIGRYDYNQDTLILSSFIQPVDDTIKVYEYFLDTISKDIAIIAITNNKAGGLFIWSIEVNNKYLMHFMENDTVGFIIFNNIDTGKIRNRFLGKEIEAFNNIVYLKTSENLNLLNIRCLGIDKDYRIQDKQSNFFLIEVYDLYNDSLRYDKRFIKPEKWLIKKNYIKKIGSEKKYIKYPK